MNKRALVEAALFVADSPLTIERMSNIVGIGSEEEIQRLLDQIKSELDVSDRGIELIHTPDGYELRVKQPYRERVAKLAPLADMSDGMLRTLAIIAVRQPIKQSLIVKYQGNKTYGYIKDLEAKGLVKSEKFGRTKIVTTTPGFERYFGQSSEELKKMLNQKFEESKSADVDEEEAGHIKERIKVED
ncbi:MAG: SMC-Scp complex subunit ScpB [Planctomycetota bacterium]